MQDPQIRYAIDPETRNVADADAGLLPKKPYECIKCRGRLVARQGTFLIWHFAHFGDDEAKACPLYYGGHYEDLLKDLRTSEVAAAETKKTIRLVAVPPAYGRSLRVYGVLPAIDISQVSDEAQLSSVLSSMSLSGRGMKVLPGAILFHPRNPEVLIELDPESAEYEVAVETGPVSLSLAGRWLGEPIRDADVFAGEPERAERTRKVNGLNRGDTVFVFARAEPRHIPDFATLYRAAGWHVVSFDLDEISAGFLKLLTGNDWRNDQSFAVDIVLPPATDPRTRHPIGGSPKSSALIAVTPPPDFDPELEVVPLGEGAISSLRKTGQGNPRWLRFSFPDGGSTRFSIHWADRHRDLHLYSRPDADAVAAPTAPLSNENQLGLNHRDEVGSRFLPASSNPDLHIPWREGTRDLDDLGIAIVGPVGLRFDVVARFGGGIVAPVVLRSGVQFGELSAEFGAWIREGLQEATLDLGPFGSIRLLVDRPAPKRSRLTDQEIRARISGVRDLPKRARWSFVRQVYGAPIGGPHNELPSGIKKQIRRILRDMRHEQTR